MENQRLQIIIKKKNQYEYIVKIKKLDNELKDFNKIYFIKIDVEGKELEVVKGASNIIKFNQPIIIFELFVDEFLNGEPEIIKFLSFSSKQLLSKFLHRSKLVIK